MSARRSFNDNFENRRRKRLFSKLSTHFIFTTVGGQKLEIGVVDRLIDGFVFEKRIFLTAPRKLPKGQSFRAAQRMITRRRSRKSLLFLFDDDVRRPKADGFSKTSVGQNPLF